ncbi:cell division protein PerM [Actinomycetospora sp. CA-101289]|uniref:cell division protein PerM n=1 Tax=Actinomycetospora sp. CA-101289 TaxID=3239893 RepID=UPI003D967962
MTVPTSDRPRRARRAAAEDTAPAAAPAWLPVLARVALLPPAVCYAVAVVLAGVVAALASGTTPGGEPGLGQALAVGVPLWLVAHLVPLQVTGVPLGVLPLAPALVLAVLVAGVARGAVRRLGAGGAARPPGAQHGVLVPVVATAAASHAVIGVLAAALLTPEAVVDASPALAAVVCGLLAGLAALAGAAAPCGVAVLPRRLPAWARHGLGGAALAATALLTAGAGLLLAGLLADGAAVHDVFADIAPEAGSGAGLALLCVAYLPNAVVAAVGWLLGPGVSVGLASAAPTGITSGLLPPVPLAALLPQSPPPSWAGLAFAVPLAVGSLVGWRLAPTARDAATRVRATATAAVGAAVLLGLAAALSGGRLGAGPFDPVTIPALPVALAALGWVLVPGVVVALLAVPLGDTRPVTPATPAPVPDVTPGAADTDPEPDEPTGDTGAAASGAAGP